MTMNKLFVDAINKGFKAAEMVTEADKKAMVYAELAKAIAKTGLVGSNVDTEDSEAPVDNKAKKNDKPAADKTGKNSLKAGADKGKAKTTKEEVSPLVEEEKQDAAPVEETEVIAPVAEGEEGEVVAEWTEEMQALKTEQLGLLQAYVDAWGEEYVYNDCLAAFSENAFKGSEYVTPLNIDGFVAYLAYLAEQVQE